jgi:hypothetical protein
MGIHPQEIGIRKAVPNTLGAKDIRRASWVREIPGPVDQEERGTCDPDMPRVGERCDQPSDMVEVVFQRVSLLLDMALFTKPPARPRLVGPGQAERELGLARGEDLGERAFEQPCAVEPVVPVAESFDAMCDSQLGLARRVSGSRRS